MARHRKHKRAKNNKAEKTDPIKAAAEFGIDISALRDNLKLSYSERIRRLQIAINTVEKLRKAKRV
jgi:DNA-binding transcriptional regulator YiaG